MPECEPGPFDSVSPRKLLWTDESVVWDEIFWLESGGFSVTDETGMIVAKGPVLHWQISSCTTELYPFMYTAQTNVPLRIFMDCQTVVKQFKSSASTLTVGARCSHQRCGCRRGGR